MDTVSAKSKGGVFTYIRDVFSTLKDGVKRYEISESECQARLMCELNQKAVGRSFKSWANSVFDLFNVEDFLEKSAFSARTKSTAKEMLRAARDGMNEKDCAILYARCPVSIAIEPAKNQYLTQQQPETKPSSSSSSPSNVPTLKAKETKPVNIVSLHQLDQSSSTPRPIHSTMNNNNNHKPIAMLLQPNKLGEVHSSYHNINSVGSQPKPLAYNQYKS